MKKRFELISSIFFMVVTLSVIIFSTFAWFTSKMDQDAFISNITCSDSNYTYKVKYYLGNYVQDGRPVEGYENTSTQNITSYNDSFLTIEQLQENNYATLQSESLVINDLYPKMRYTFAIEITTDYLESTDIALNFKQFEATVKDKVTAKPYRLDDDPALNDTPILLTEALDFYTYAICVERDSTSDAPIINDVTTINEFLNNAGTTAYPDKFVDESGNKYLGDSFLPGQSCELSKGTMLADESKKYTLVFFITIEFSNSHDIYYSFVGYENDDPTSNKRYYRRDTNGSMNAFQNMSFKIVNIDINRV